MLTHLLRSRIHQEYSYDTAPLQLDEVNNNGADNEDEELEFHLFTPSANSKSQAQPKTHKIRLNSPFTGDGPGGFVVPQRPGSYYFTGELDVSAKKELDAVVVEGDDVLKRAQWKWPGCTLPWRVTTISATGLKNDILTSHTNAALEPGTRKRSRAGKKHRIALRKKAQLEKQKKEQAQKIMQMKEEADKEKRTRRNREKKIKKKAKEKAKKMESVKDKIDGNEDVAAAVE